jgi:predicted  nucleic acid-binding Zn-ribbon protein
MASKVIAEGKGTAERLDAEAIELKKRFANVKAGIESIEKIMGSDDKKQVNEGFFQLNRLSSQLEDIEKKVIEKVAAFTDLKRALVRADTDNRHYKPIYHREVDVIKDEKDRLDAEIKKLMGEVEDRDLARKYEEINDLAVMSGEINKEFCQACGSSMPLALMEIVKSRGWTVCETCGRIVYANPN